MVKYECRKISLRKILKGSYNTLVSKYEKEKNIDRPCIGYVGSTVADEDGKVICEECGWERFYHNITVTERKLLLQENEG